jgi:hypothetical protein
MQIENGASFDTIKLALEEQPVQPVSFAEMQRRDEVVAKGLRPTWNDEAPKDYSSVTDTSLDVDGALQKATTGRVDPDAATAEIVANVLKRLADDSDFRKTDEREPEETDDEDEPKEAPAELREDMEMLRRVQAMGKDIFDEIVNPALNKDYQRGLQLARAAAWLEDEAA